MEEVRALSVIEKVHAAKKLLKEVLVELEGAEEKPRVAEPVDADAESGEKAPVEPTV